MSQDSQKETFMALLGSTDTEAQKKRAIRMATTAKMDYDTYVSTETKKLFDLESQLEAMNDISASNSSLSMNAIKPAEFDSTDYVARRCDILIKIEVQKRKLKAIEADKDFYVIPANE